MKYLYSFVSDQQVPFAHRLLQALVKMSFSSSRLRAKHFFDLHHPSAVSIVSSMTYNYSQTSESFISTSRLLGQYGPLLLSQSIIKLFFKICFLSGYLSSRDPKMAWK